MSLTDDLVRAIATLEGYFKLGSIAQRNNNPGNLRRWGNLPVKDGYAVFPTPEAGGPQGIGDDTTLAALVISAVSLVMLAVG